MHHIHLLEVKQYMSTVLEVIVAYVGGECCTRHILTVSKREDGNTLKKIQKDGGSL